MRIILALLTIAVFAWADAYIDGLAAMDRDDYQTAVRHFTEAIKIDPNSAMAYRERGISYHRLGDYTKAIADCTQFIELDPSARAYNDRSYLYHGLNDYKNATKDAKKACELGECFMLEYLKKNNQIRN
ncbi:hypothetical protein FACS189487_09970 [Campylobacterota bacterium]|nr:hypothetical protein FACS189487_09970 [Campylobacterota bacterium]